MKVWVCEETIDYEGIYGFSLFHSRDDAIKDLRTCALQNSHFEVEDGKHYKSGAGDVYIYEEEIK